jgi:hypothetical protein
LPFVVWREAQRLFPRALGNLHKVPCEFHNSVEKPNNWGSQFNFSSLCLFMRNVKHFFSPEEFSFRLEIVSCGSRLMRCTREADQRTCPKN